VSLKLLEPRGNIDLCHPLIAARALWASDRQQSGIRFRHRAPLPNTHSRAQEKIRRQIPACSVAPKSQGGERDEGHLDDHRADRQDPDYMFCLTVHEIPTLEALD
jgi:hypothetical protein